MKTKVRPTFASAAIHGGKGKKDQYGSHTSPIYQTSTFVFEDVESGAKAFRHEEGGASHVYSRLGNPTVEELERAICALETYNLNDPRGIWEWYLAVVWQRYPPELSALPMVGTLLPKTTCTVVHHNS